MINKETKFIAGAIIAFTIITLLFIIIANVSANDLIEIPTDRQDIFDSIEQFVEHNSDTK